MIDFKQNEFDINDKVIFIKTYRNNDYIMIIF